MHIALDIDGFLACRRTNEAHDSFFQKHGSVYECLQTYYIFPGILEFIKCLYKTEGLTFSFFSAGTSERNQLFCSAIITAAIMNEPRKQIRIYMHSRKDLTSLPDQPFTRIKDIRKIAQINNNIENTILIDDTREVIALSQRQNWLYVPTTSEEHFDKLKRPRRLESYKESYKLLDCIFLETTPDLKKFAAGITYVEQGKAIMILSDASGITVNFLNESYEYTTCVIPNSELLTILQSWYERGDVFSHIITDQIITKRIYDLVLSFNGKISKISRAVNRIYYVTGLLFSAIEKATREQISLVKSLNVLQVENKSIYRDDLYELGLKKLREINPKLEFVSPRKYRDCTSLSLLN